MTWQAQTSLCQVSAYDNVCSAPHTRTTAHTATAPLALFQTWSEDDNADSIHDALQVRASLPLDPTATAIHRAAVIVFLDYSLSVRGPARVHATLQLSCVYSTSPRCIHACIQLTTGHSQVDDGLTSHSGQHDSSAGQVLCCRWRAATEPTRLAAC